MPRVSTTAYMGIDPGANGGIVVIRHGFAYPAKMPETERDIWLLINSFQRLNPGNVTAVIEYINPAFKGTGKGSMSKLYGSYMALRMALTAADIPFEIAMTQKWARPLGIPPRNQRGDTEWKNLLKAKAQQLYPKLTVTLAIADALLIATYCQRKHEGKL